MKKILCVAPLLLAAGVSTSVSAEVLTFSFTGSIDYMFEHDHTKNINTSVESSSFTGALIKKSDVVAGTFSYNTDANLSTAYQPSQPATGSYLVYLPDAAVSKITFEVGAGLATFMSASTPIAAPIAIIGNDNANGFGWDTFYIGASKAYDPVMFQDANISLFDKTGMAFSAGGMPTSLKLADFHYARLDGGWLRQSSGDQMHIFVNLTQLIVVSQVPEPSSCLLLLLGLGAIGTTALRAEQRRETR
jgi:hypothetical protein